MVLSSLSRLLPTTGKNLLLFRPLQAPEKPISTAEYFHRRKRTQMAFLRQGTGSTKTCASPRSQKKVSPNVLLAVGKALFRNRYSPVSPHSIKGRGMRRKTYEL